MFSILYSIFVLPLFSMSWKTCHSSSFNEISIFISVFILQGENLLKRLMRDCGCGLILRKVFPVGEGGW